MINIASDNKERAAVVSLIVCNALQKLFCASIHDLFYITSFANSIKTLSNIIKESITYKKDMTH